MADAPGAPAALDAVVAAVRASAKYRHIDPALVAALAARELSSGARPKDAAKQVKNKLHQVAGAYQVEPLHPESWLAAVRTCLERAGHEHTPGDPQGLGAPEGAGAQSQGCLRDLCRTQMARHASTRERLPILDEFYAQVLGGLPPVGSLLDLACGLNPLALPWMNLPPTAAYWACDIYTDQVDFLNRWVALAGRAGGAFLFDLINDLPAVGGATVRPPAEGAGAEAQPARRLPRADVVLLLKAVPCLQQVDREIGRRLLDAIDAPTLIISYPAHSLGGHKHGMRGHYAAEFDRLVEGRGWHVEPFSFATELVYRIRR
jgi:16S rRNA (guanine(1405)-N(7))-methyltransferase